MIAQEAEATTDKGSYAERSEDVYAQRSTFVLTTQHHHTGFIRLYVVACFSTRAASFAFFSGCAIFSMLILIGAVKTSRSGLVLRGI